MVYPSVIKEKDLPNYSSSYCVSELRKVMSRTDPDPEIINRLLNGSKYDRSIR